MRPDLTDITVVLDRSGSMASCRSDAEGGLNHFIQEQAKQPGTALFSLVQFNTEYEFVHRGVNLQHIIPVFHLNPSGRTALLDAIGRAIVETGERLKNIQEHNRPGLVVFVILTDGLENASKEYTRSRIKEMLQHQESVYKWKFTYLGANQDAFAEAGTIGINLAAVANYNAEEKTSGTFRLASDHVSKMRGEVAVGSDAVNEYTDEQRKMIQ